MSVSPEVDFVSPQVDFVSPQVDFVSPQVDFVLPQVDFVLRTIPRTEENRGKEEAHSKHKIVHQIFLLCIWLNTI